MIRHKLKFIYIVLLIVFLLLNGNFAFAETDNTVQEKCYNNLISNIKKIPFWGEGYENILAKKYSDIVFSKKYKNMSSFGVDIDEPLFEMKLYSFGRQTGYQHPPYSPFPTYTKTDKWYEKSKEFIMAEEYIKSPSGKKQFLSCSFMQIESGDLMNVTSENYLYDGEIISVIQKEKDGYKAWYNENVSYDHSNNPFVTWKRLFIFPKETQNDYFDKYSVLESFPTNEVDDLSKIIIKNEKGKPLGFKGEGMINSASRIYFTDDNGIITNYLGDKNLSPILKNGFDKIFALNSYYQSIENNFPEFSEKLALRGLVHYDLLKEMLATGDNDNFAHIWNTVLDARDITKYSLNKKNNKLEQEDEFYENQLSNLSNIESDIKELLEKYKDTIKKQKEAFMKKENIIINKKVVENNKIIKDTIEYKGYNKNTLFYSLVLILITLIFITFFLSKRKNNS